MRVLESWYNIDRDNVPGSLRAAAVETLTLVELFMMVLSSSSMYLVYFLAGLVTFLCLIRKITSFRESLRSVRYVSVTSWSIAMLRNSIRYLSGYRYLFAPFSFVGLFSPQIPYFCGSIDLHFNEKHTRGVHRIFSLGGANADLFSFCQSWLGCHLIGMLRVVRLQLI